MLPSTYSSSNWKLVSFDYLSPILPPLTLLSLVTTNLISFYEFGLFFRFCGMVLNQSFYTDSLVEDGLLGALYFSDLQLVMEVRLIFYRKTLYSFFMHFRKVAKELICCLSQNGILFNFFVCEMPQIHS